MTPGELDEYVARVVAQAPPLSPEKRARIAGLLSAPIDLPPAEKITVTRSRSPWTHHYCWCAHDRDQHDAHGCYCGCRGYTPITPPRGEA